MFVCAKNFVIYVKVYLTKFKAETHISPSSQSVADHQLHLCATLLTAGQTGAGLNPLREEHHNDLTTVPSHLYPTFNQCAHMTQDISLWMGLNMVHTKDDELLLDFCPNP
ncbi:hypothetical protein KIN20_007037 [Parelaphostrongylus tenuis]|uniref:Uncharacterized protein n=1 Tax=Parelaphostrongylus tenuis TaxID=148309 RepID=A0AAD5QGI4_PARTN|nr:hypothetical protein KIN20_007037 [Parelaphostrongylus tenuis]